MAFTNATGYNNLSQGNFTPQIFSQKVQKFFRRASVVEDITNTDYAGEIENFGDTVKMKNYDYNVLKFIYDNATNGTSTGTDASPIDGDAAVDTLANLVSTLKKNLDKNDVPEENRWLVAPPEFFEQLRKAGGKLSDQSVMNDGAASQIRNGKVTDRPLFGFNMYSSNAIAVSGGSAASHTFGSSGSNEYAFVYGHMSGVATVNHIAKTELIRDPDSFADVVRGLHVFGRKILRSEAVQRGVITIG